MKIPAHSQSELATWGVFKFQGEVPEHVSNEIPASFDQTGSQFTDKAIISVLADLDKNDLWDIIYQQFMTLEKPSSSKLTSILMFDNEQYRVYDILSLKLRQFDGHHQTLSLESEELLEIKAIIVEEISVVSGTLFTSLSNMFGSLHKNHKCNIKQKSSMNVDRGEG
ncbi:16332_t:CDS:2 [Entrophospora sp. SA101]|nr:16332_t:CDS:2 [Entrophospora sp. SA101]